MGQISDLSSSEARERIRRAVDEAEGRTAGEIVPFVVAASDSYEGAHWRGATLGALVGSLGSALVQRYGSFWGGDPLVVTALPPMLGAVVGFAAVLWLPWLKRWLVPTEVLEARVARRAEAAFLEEEVFRTEERTGILIFLSLFERRVAVLGDEGINRRVEPGEWEGVVERLVAGIRSRRPAEALVEAIVECGHLLERRGVEIRPDDVDELEDELRTRER